MEIAKKKKQSRQRSGRRRDVKPRDRNAISRVQRCPPRTLPAAKVVVRGLPFSMSEQEFDALLKPWEDSITYRYYRKGKQTRKGDLVDSVGWIGFNNSNIVVQFKSKVIETISADQKAPIIEFSPHPYIPLIQEYKPSTIENDPDYIKFMEEMKNMDKVVSTESESPSVPENVVREGDVILSPILLEIIAQKKIQEENRLKKVQRNKQAKLEKQQKRIKKRLAAREASAKNENTSAASGTTQSAEKSESKTTDSSQPTVATGPLLQMGMVKIAKRPSNLSDPTKNSGTTPSGADTIASPTVPASSTGGAVSSLTNIQKNDQASLPNAAKADTHKITSSNQKQRVNKNTKQANNNSKQFNRQNKNGYANKKQQHAQKEKQQEPKILLNKDKPRQDNSSNNQQHELISFLNQPDGAATSYSSKPTHSAATAPAPYSPHLQASGSGDTFAGNASLAQSKMSVTKSNFTPSVSAISIVSNPSALGSSSSSSGISKITISSASISSPQFVPSNNFSVPAKSSSTFIPSQAALPPSAQFVPGPSAKSGVLAQAQPIASESQYQQDNSGRGRGTGNKKYAGDATDHYYYGNRGRGNKPGYLGGTG